MPMPSIVKYPLNVLSKYLTNSPWSRQPAPYGKDSQHMPLLVHLTQSKLETKFWFMPQQVEWETSSFRLQKMQVPVDITAMKVMKPI